MDIPNTCCMNARKDSGPRRSGETCIAHKTQKPVCNHAGKSDRDVRQEKAGKMPLSAHRQLWSGTYSPPQTAIRSCLKSDLAETRHGVPLLSIFIKQ